MKSQVTCYRDLNPEHTSGALVPGSILAVIVLYKTPPADSDTFKTLTAQVCDVQAQGYPFQILLYDNTPGGQTCPQLPEFAVYHSAARNEGIAGAYSVALEFASQYGFSWMLTLDQDTQLQPGFLARIHELAIQEQPNEKVAAIVPQLSCAERLFSPVRVRPWGASYLPRGFTGVAEGEIFAVNSASLFRVDALNRIGGFDRRFWLDYQDAYIYHQLYRSGMRIRIAGEIQVEHDLSLISRKRSIGADRFDNFLRAESAFCDLYGTALQRLALTARLACRLWRLRKQRSDVALQRLTKVALRRRLLLSRKRRIHDWERDLRQRFSSGNAGQME